MPISLTESNVVVTLLECTLYGIFLVLSLASLFLLVRRQLGSTNPWLSTSSNGRRCSWPCSLAGYLSIIYTLAKSPFMVANILFMLTITAHWLIDIQRLVYAIVSEGGDKSAIESFFDDLQNRTQVAQTALMFMDMIIGDAIITYRTWLVWGKRRWVVIFPFLSISTLIASGIGLLYSESRANRVFVYTITRWVIAFGGATLCTTLYGTIMIAYRILSVNRLIKRENMTVSSIEVTSALAIFVESAALYAVGVILTVIFYLSQSSLETIGPICGPEIIGITFTLITVRVGLGWGENLGRATSSSLGTLAFAGRTSTQRRGEESLAMTTFNINITPTAAAKQNEGSHIMMDTGSKSMSTLETAVMNK